MKKLFTLSLVLLAVAALPNCKRCCKKVCAEPTVQQEEKRVSGPLADKEVNWDKEDFK